MNDVLTGLIQMGFLGPVVAGLAVAVWRLQQQLTRVQEDRVNDAQKAVERIYALKGSVDDLSDVVERLCQRISHEDLPPKRRGAP